MKVRKRARLLNHRRSEERKRLYARSEQAFQASLRRARNPRPPVFAQAINAMTDAELDDALERGKANGLYETFRRLRQ